MIVNFQFKCKNCGCVFEMKKEAELPHNQERCISCGSFECYRVWNLTPVIYNALGFTKRVEREKQDGEKTW